MSLKNVLLSLLREPMSGSDLIALFQSSIEHFWNADLSQIYRALEKLERDGEVRSTSVPSPKGPVRRVYALTDTGRASLVAWVADEPRVPPLKLDYLAQLFSVTASSDPKRDALRLLRKLRGDAVAAARVLEGIEAAMEQIPGYPDDLPTHLFYPWLTLRHGLHRRRALVSWIDDSMQRLERRQITDGAQPDAIAALLRQLEPLGELK